METNKLNNQQMELLDQEDDLENEFISQAANKVKYRFEETNQIVQEVLSC
jgi:hypothetical protein